MLGVKRKKVEKDLTLGTIKITDQMKKEYLEKKQVRDFLTTIPHLKLKEIKQHKKQKKDITLVEKTNMEKEPVVLWEKTTSTVSDLVAKEMISVIKSLSFNDYVSVIVLLHGKPILFPGKFKGMNGDTFLLKDVQENVLSLKQIVFIRKLSKTEYEKQEQEKKKHIETFLEKKKKEDEALVDWENLKVSLTKTRDSLFIKERREKIRKLLKTKKYVSRQFLVDMFTFYDSIFFNNQLRKKCKNQNVKIDFEESEKVSNKCVRFGLKKQKDDFKRALFTLYKENTNKLLTSETSLMPNEFYICCNVQCQTPLKSLMVMFEHELVELFVFAFNISSETANKMRVLFFGHSL